MLEMLKMAQIFSEMQASRQTEDPRMLIQSAVMNNKKINPQFLEDRVQSPGMKILKEILPYMDSKHSHVLETFVKIMELQKLTEMYSGIAVNLRNNNQDWRIEMLSAMRPHLDADKQEKVDMAMCMFNLSNLMQKMGNRSVAERDKY